MAEELEYWCEGSFGIFMREGGNGHWVEDARFFTTSSSCWTLCKSCAAERNKAGTGKAEAWSFDWDHTVRATARIKPKPCPAYLGRQEQWINPEGRSGKWTESKYPCILQEGHEGPHESKEIKTELRTTANRNNCPYSLHYTRTWSTELHINPLSPPEIDVWGVIPCELPEGHEGLHRVFGLEAL